jgi:hypothetical protein
MVGNPVSSANTAETVTQVAQHMTEFKLEQYEVHKQVVEGSHKEKKKLPYNKIYVLLIP